MRFWGYSISNPYRSKTPKNFYHPVRGHSGIDVGCPSGTPLWLHFPTTCILTREQPQMGKTVYLMDRYGNILVFAHNSEFICQKGDRVAMKQIFAISGNSGTSPTGGRYVDHSHFEVIAQMQEMGGEIMIRTGLPFNGYNIDPVAYYQDMLRKLAKVSRWKKMTNSVRVFLASLFRKNAKT